MDLKEQVTNVAIIAVAGMPGSMKSTLMKEYEGRGYRPFDDVNRDWGGNIAKIRTLAAQGKDMIISDIEFCNDAWRTKLSNELKLPVTWVFFENNPYHCARNVLFRVFEEGEKRSWVEEIQKIDRLTKVYKPLGDIRPVVLADSLPKEAR